MPKALFHFDVRQIKRSAGQSAIACAAYRAGEKLYSDNYGEWSDYSQKGGVIHSEILLPNHAPREYADRQTLWNAVEFAERGKKAQLAYSFELALQTEFSVEENMALARQFLLEHFVSRGMIMGVCFHEPDREPPNPHIHFLCPIRPLNPDGSWGQKQRREYLLDENGERLKELRKLLAQADTVDNLRPVYGAYRNLRFEKQKAKYKTDHEPELRKYFAARRELEKAYPDGTFDGESLEQELSQLQAEYDEAYARFREVKSGSDQMWKLKKILEMGESALAIRNR